jgi:Flp pilus assembly protein TadG
VGIVSTLIGFLVTMSLLLLAVQVSYGLYQRSMLDAVASDAARIVSGSDAGASPAAEALADQQARVELGGAGAAAEFAWTTGAGNVSVSISLPAARFLPAFVARPLGLSRVTGRSQYRIEAPG